MYMSTVGNIKCSPRHGLQCIELENNPNVNRQWMNKREEESALHNQNGAESTVTPIYCMNLGPSRRRAMKETRRRLQRHWYRWHEAHKQEKKAIRS